MYDQQKLRGSVYDQEERNSDDFKKINKTHFKMRVGTNGLSYFFISTSFKASVVPVAVNFKEYGETVIIAVSRSF
jgi:hypothetical protein